LVEISYLYIDYYGLPNQRLTLTSYQLKNLFKLFSLAIILLPTTVLATVYTVSNNANRPAQYTNLQTAADAAAPNDTLLVTGSPATYGTLTLYKPLVVYGEAIEGSEFPITTLGTVYCNRLNSSLSSSGSRFYGFHMTSINFSGSFSGSTAGQNVLNDFIVERCRINSGMTNTTYDGLSDVTFRNCYFRNSIITLDQEGAIISDVSSIIFTNNVFENTLIRALYGLIEFNGNVVIRNNIFIDRTTYSFQNAQQLVLENNIFYKAEPTGLENSTFNNNLTYLCNDNTIPYGTNIGSGNIENVDPMLVNYPALGGVDHSWDWDYSLQPGSPAIGTGTNGSDIGINGGNSPVANLYRYAKIPAVTTIDVPVSSVPVGGTLQINIEAVSRD
jgi:hypothetical protein